MIPLLIGIMLRSLLLGIGVALALAVLRVRNPYLQKTAWTAVLVSALVMPVFMRAHGPAIEAPAYLLTLTPAAIGPAASSSVRPGIAAIYGAVALLMLTRYALRLTRLVVIRRKARRVAAPWAAGLDVRVAAEVSSPATFGSTILLPEEYMCWSAQKREAIMAHERAHALAHDCQWLWLAKLYKCLFWLNPLAWWLERRIAALAEETSDAAALRVVGDAPVYAEILLEFAAARGRTATLATGIGSPISERIERIVGGNAAADVPRMWRRFSVSAAAMAAMFLCATLQLAQNHWAFAHERMTVAGHSSAVGPAAGAPRVLSWPAVRQLIPFYPSQARRAGIDGSVTLAVSLDDKGRATDTKVLTEAPLNFGFGAAASAVARVMKYSNPTGRAAQLELRIKFALHHAHPSATPSR